LQPHGERSGLRVLHQDLGGHGIGWIDEHRDTSRARYQLAQDFQSLGC
jgi:hypothetical protein